ncbi:MAG: hypothetical protein WCA17_00925 [Burkholderiales bacterium]
MNRVRFYGICRQLSGTVTERWGMLTGNPLAVAAGRRDRLTGRIEAQRGALKQQADRQLADFISRNRGWKTLSRH